MFAFVLPDHGVGVSFEAAVDLGVRDAFAQHGTAFRTMDHIAEEAPALSDVPALGEQPRAVGELVLHGVVVEQLVLVGPDLASALPLCLDGPGVL